MEALHCKRTLPSMTHPMQVKPPHTPERNREERKLFIGMLSKNSDEEFVKKMLSDYGTVEECDLMRHRSGRTKCCAFATMGSRDECLSAMKGLHRSRTMEGASEALVVTLADSKREREARMLQHSMRASGGGYVYMTADGYPRLADHMALQPFSGVHAQAALAAAASTGVAPPSLMGNPNPAAYQPQQQVPVEWAVCFDTAVTSLFFRLSEDFGVVALDYRG
ncbi:CUGBP Elav-like family member 6 [Sycon ciliatum]|uniref:CUGBP Elav-like family member 6 n=1 Tax=Sycon ciliatum TaxID=27933 RepID=UPI0031F69999